jgi:hypothetical protein
VSAGTAQRHGLARLFGGRRIVCPYCLRHRRLRTEIVETYEMDLPPDDPPPGDQGHLRGKVYTCDGREGCGAKIPVAYVDDYDVLPRVFCPMGGLPAHGKTVYLVSLLVELADTAPWLWRTSNLVRGEGIHDVIEWMHLWRTSGQLPGSNQFMTLPNCIVLRMAGLPTLPAPFHLMLQDTSGEVIHNEARIRNARFLTNAPVLVLFVSLPNLRRDGLQTNESVLALYMNAVRSMTRRGGRQSLLVVLTKGDELLDTDADSLPLQARRALRATPEELYAKDPVADHERREELSEALEEWLLRQPNFGGAVLTARDVFTEVRYCVVSATGAAPVVRDDDLSYLSGPATPRAIFDPLTWIVDLQADRALRLQLAAELETRARRASPDRREDVEAARANLRRRNYDLTREQLRRLRESEPRPLRLARMLVLLALAAAGVLGWRWLGR